MPTSEISSGRLGIYLIFAIAAVVLFGLQIWLILSLEINWDEFFFLSQIYDFQRGDLASGLQTFHVHFFGWITHVPGNEVDQVTAGRLVMLGFLLGTSALIFRLAREFFTRTHSAMAVLAYATAGPIVIYGASFRTDPIAAFFTMLALVTLACGARSLRMMMLAGISAAVAALITMKVALYAPAFFGAVLWRLKEEDNRRQTLVWLAGGAAVAAVVFTALYAIHFLMLNEDYLASGSEVVSNAAGTTLFNPQWNYVEAALKIATIQALLIVMGTVGAILALFRATGEDRFRLLAIVSCAATLICLLFYRNVYPYFFPFILPPAMLSVAWLVEKLRVVRSPFWVAAANLTLLLPGLMVGATWLLERKSPPQRLVIDAVHVIFPEPVPMIDQFHVIGSFPKRGFFMSSWGLTNYRVEGPIFADILNRDTVPLLLVDGPILAQAITTATAGSPPTGFRGLFEEDRAILGANYIQHWGPIWVAGKQFGFARTGEFEIRIPGNYVLEGSGALIDGKALTSGEVVELQRGTHSFVNISNLPWAIRWDKAERGPSSPPPTGRLFTPFFERST